MNSEKVISNIKKAIKEHLDNNYTYDMLVDFELDVIDWNSLFEYIDKLQQEMNEDNAYDKRVEITLTLLNNNVEKVKFSKEEVENIPIKLQVKIHQEINKFIYDSINDPN